VQALEGPLAIAHGPSELDQLLAHRQPLLEVRRVQ
jgi:hypothetical protein